MTITDMERNGILDIAGGQAGVFGGNSRCFWIWDRFGQVRSGFPYYSSHGGGSEGPLTAADIEGNGLHEIFADHNVTIGGKCYLFGVTEAGGGYRKLSATPNRIHVYEQRDDWRCGWKWHLRTCRRRFC